jgi:hypothetical protein
MTRFNRQNAPTHTRATVDWVSLKKENELLRVKNGGEYTYRELSLGERIELAAKLLKSVKSLV